MSALPLPAETCTLCPDYELFFVCHSFYLYFILFIAVLVNATNAFSMLSYARFQRIFNIFVLQIIYVGSFLEKISMFKFFFLRCVPLDSFVHYFLLLFDAAWKIGTS